MVAVRSYRLSMPYYGLVLARHDDAAKEWGALGARALVPSAITYKPKINSRLVPAQDVLFALILWYVAKTLFRS